MPFYGFAGECIQAEGVITLLVTIGMTPHQICKMVDFLVIDKHSSYNAIIGRPTPNAIKAVILTYHLMMKFLTESSMGILQGDQTYARECYAMSAVELAKKADPQG